MYASYVSSLHKHRYASMFASVSTYTVCLYQCLLKAFQLYMYELNVNYVWNGSIFFSLCIHGATEAIRIYTHSHTVCVCVCPAVVVQNARFHHNTPTLNVFSTNSRKKRTENTGCERVLMLNAASDWFNLPLVVWKRAASGCQLSLSGF